MICGDVSLKWCSSLVVTIISLEADWSKVLLLPQDSEERTSRPWWKTSTATQQPRNKRNRNPEEPGKSDLGRWTKTRSKHCKDSSCELSGDPVLLFLFSHGGIYYYPRSSNNILETIWKSSFFLYLCLKASVVALKTLDKYNFSICNLSGKRAETDKQMTRRQKWADLIYSEQRHLSLKVDLCFCDLSAA